MTEDELASLKRNRQECKDHIVTLQDELHRLDKARKQLLEVYKDWKLRYEELDMQLALETKLTIIEPKKKSSDPIEKLAKDPNKLQKLIDALSAELLKSKEAKQLTPNVPLTNT